MNDGSGSIRDRLRASWPPDEAPRGGYRAGALDATRPVAATSLGPRAAVALAAEADGGGLGSAPLVPVDADGAIPSTAAGRGAWRVAAAGDGAAAALLGALVDGRALEDGFVARATPAGQAVLPAAPAGPERPMGVDQTNASVVVGERVVVKWYRRPDPRGERAPRLLRHLASAGFDGAPALLGTLEWARGDGPAVTVATADAFLPGARDGWEWTVEAVLRHASPRHRCGPRCPAGFAAALGRLAARLHVALATPSDEIPAPLGHAGADEVAGWVAAGERTLDEALDLTTGDDAAAGRALAAWVPAIRARLGSLRLVDGTLVQPIHGDLHVGQLPAWRDGVAVIDFDGNPSLAPDERRRPQPAARDVAQLLCSLDHVGRIAMRRGRERGSDVGPAVDAWIAASGAALLEAYRRSLADAGRPELLDERLLPAMTVEQELRELVYAARFLPRWRYAPMGAIRAMVGA